MDLDNLQGYYILNKIKPSYTKISFPYEIITRADRLNEEALDLLKASGCFRVWIGAESGSQKIIDTEGRVEKFERKYTNKKQAPKKLENLKK